VIIISEKIDGNNDVARVGGEKDRCISYELIQNFSLPAELTNMTSFKGVEKTEQRPFIFSNKYGQVPSKKF
jgi:hypothetical protein